MGEPTRLELELWALGELDGARLSEVEQLLAADPDLAAHAARIREEVADAAIDLPPLPSLAETPSAANRPLAAWGLGGLLALAAALVVGVVLRPVDPVEPGVQFRGALDVEVHRVRGGAAEPVGALAKVRAGDRLQYSVTADAPGYVAVFDLQDDGVLSEWLAARPVRALEAAEGAVLLDDYAGSERVFFLFAADPISERDVEAALTRTYDVPLAELDVLSLPESVRQRSILLLRDTN